MSASTGSGVIGDLAEVRARDRETYRRGLGQQAFAPARFTRCRRVHHVAMVIEVDPGRAVGPVILGSSFTQAGERLATWGTPTTHAPYPGAAPLDWKLSTAGIDIHVFCGSAGVVQNVEIYRNPVAALTETVLLMGLNLYAQPAEQVLEAIQAQGIATEGDLDMGLIMPELAVALSRNDLEDGAPFDYVLVAPSGYFD